MDATATATAPATIDHDKTRPRHLWDAREYQPGSHQAITEATGPFPSFSTVAGLYTNAGALMAWAAKINSEAYKAQFVENGKFVHLEHAVEIVSDTGHYRRETKRAGQAGTDMHEVFQSLLTGAEYLTAEPSLTTDEARTALALRNWIASRDYRQYSGEQIVADPHHLTAGRYDSLGPATFKRSERVYLVDLKTGKSVKPSSFLQVAGYFFTPDIQQHDPHGAIILHAPIGCDTVNEIVLTRKELREHYKAFLAVRALWDWHVKHGALR